MSKESMISREELEMYEKTEINEELVEKAKNKSSDSFMREMFRQSLIELKKELDEDERIVDYVRGFNNESEETRLFMSFVIPSFSNPIFFNWSSTSALVKTNKRLFVIELDMFNKTANKFKINKDDFTIYKDKKLATLIFKRDNGKDYSIQFNTERVDRFKNFLEEYNLKMVNKKFKNTTSRINNILFIVAMIMVIAVIIKLILVDCLPLIK
ncbi:hypothetical protein UT300003_26360 [Clostridium sardiniense]